MQKVLQQIEQIKENFEKEKHETQKELSQLRVNFWFVFNVLISHKLSNI